MLAGVLADSGYNTGDNYILVREANPRGFFEDREVNSINEALLAQVLPPRPTSPPRLWRYLWRTRLGMGQRWLAVLPPKVEVPRLSGIDERIRAVLKEPYALKDPRFCYTLPVWQPHLGDTRFVCIFREPSRTIASLLREVATAGYLRDVSLSRRRAALLWKRMYERVLDHRREGGKWLFVHYDQVLDGSAIPRLEEFLWTPLTSDRIDSAFKRSAAGKEPSALIDLYQELCSLAGM